MNPFLLPRRAFGRIRHRLEIRRHTARDHARLLRWREELEIDDSMRIAMAARFSAEGPFVNAPRLRSLLSSCLDDALRAGLVDSPVEDARRLLLEAMEAAARGECTLFGLRFSPENPGGYRHDPLRDEPWPLRPHAEIRLDQPSRPGDIRMVWELARFHHALLLLIGERLEPSPRWALAFREITRRFLRENPPFDGPQWAVGMEVAIRAAAWLFTADAFACAGAPAEDEEHALAWVDALLLHGLFLETHPERHPHGFTTNHTLSDYAGLALLGRAFDAWPVGERWRRSAASDLAECLTEQVLSGGAHAEASLPYQRYVLEASFVASLALEESERVPLLEPIARLARNLGEARLGRRLPAIGDGDESFFPPFAILPFALRDPLDPTLLLRLVEDAIPEATRPSAELASGGRGFARFRSGAFDGILVHRAAGEGFFPTHGHNDLLSICLDVEGEPLFIDPGTGGYGVDRALRHRLRSTAAHSTLAIEGEEQRPLRPLATFEGPTAPRGGITRDHAERFDLEAWHEGYRDLRHTRRLRAKLGLLIVEDHLGRVASWGAGRGDQPLASTLRLRLPPSATIHQVDERRLALRVGRQEVELLLLRPRGGAWQIRVGAYSERYGASEEAPVIELSLRAPLPHRFRFALRVKTSAQRGAADSIDATSGNDASRKAGSPRQ